nr:unnamed protein product [Spirometra erinaceieuropaei]
MEASQKASIRENLLLISSAIVEAPTRGPRKQPCPSSLPPGYRYCSKEYLLKEELAYLYRLFRSNAYPTSFVKNRLRRHAQLRDPTSPGEIATPKFYSLPYMQGTTELIAGEVNRLGIRIANKLTSLLPAALSRVKDAISKEQSTNAFYRIPCANCLCVHAGHMGRSLETRINEHKLAVRHLDRLPLVFAHALECGQLFSGDDVEVVATANTKTDERSPGGMFSNADSVNHLDAHYEGQRSCFTDPCSMPHQRSLIQPPTAPQIHHSPAPPPSNTESHNCSLLLAQKQP